jgi:hypothetical protein
MPAEWIIRVILLSVVHWVLAGFMLNDMASRARVFGGHKAPWVIAVVTVPCLGSLLYLAFHPQIFYPDED